MNHDFQEYVRQIIHSWQVQQKKGAYKIIKKYGYPQEATASRLIWYHNGPWKRTIVHQDAVRHHFPTTRRNYLEQTIRYHIPVNIIEEIAHFDGSCYLDHTRGEVTSICDEEEANILTLNMFHEIVTGERTVADARKCIIATISNLLNDNIRSPYVEKFVFPQPFNTEESEENYFPYSKDLLYT